MKKRLVCVVVLGASLAPVLARSAMAEAPYVWSVDGSVDNSGLPAGAAPGVPLGPNVSTAPDGSRIELDGVGRLDPKAHRINGGGNYRVLDRSGRVKHEGSWKAVSLARFADVGTEPEGSPVEFIRAGSFVAPITLSGLGRGRLTFLCGLHDEKTGEELEGVRVEIGSKRFGRIDAGSTTLERQ